MAAVKRRLTRWMLGLAVGTLLPDGVRPGRQLACLHRRLPVAPRARDGNRSLEETQERWVVGGDLMVEETG